MKKFKYALWVLLIGFLGLLVYQNKGVFLAKYSLDINLGVARYHVPELYSIVIIAIFFCLGWLIAYAAGLFERFNAKRQMRLFRQTIDSYSGTISALKQEVEGLKPNKPSEEAMPEPDPAPPVPAENETAQA